MMRNENFNLTVSQAKAIRANWKNLETIYLVGTNHSAKEIKELNAILPGKLVFFVQYD